MIVKDSIKLFFYPEHPVHGNHVYIDEFGNIPTSCTTRVDEYINKKDFKAIAKSCARIGTNKRHPKYLKYRGKTAKQLLSEWEATTKIALDRGNERHDFLDDNIRLTNNFGFLKRRAKDNQCYTVGMIDPTSNVGNINIDDFRNNGINERFPEIYNLIEFFIKKGYKIFSELGVYSYEYLTSGLIDLPIFKGNDFIIIDWKTNKGDIPKYAGYYLKNDDGSLGMFHRTHEYMLYPLNHLEDSVYNHYALQLSIYAFLLELQGYKCNGLILNHITHSVYKEDDKKVIKNPKLLGKEKINKFAVPYLKAEVKAMLTASVANDNKKIQRKLQLA